MAQVLIKEAQMLPRAGQSGADDGQNCADAAERLSKLRRCFWESVKIAQMMFKVSQVLLRAGQIGADAGPSGAVSPRVGQSGADAGQSGADAAGSWSKLRR